VDSTDPAAIKVSITIRNTGKYKGEEVVQLYIRDKVASVVRPVKELRGFKKINLKPGEEAVVEFRLTDAELGFYTESGAFVVEPGEFDVMVGTNSLEGLTAKFTLK
jgi:beta-glucosidase